MANNSYAVPIKQAHRFFSRTVGVFIEEDAAYAPVAGQFTVAQHIAHVAQTIDWFIAGGFSDEGFSLDFAEYQRQVRAVQTLGDAQAWLDRSIANATEVLGTITQQRMLEPLPEGPVMAGQPRAAVVGAICEHTAHHRGALAVYARLRGLNPPMPYTD